MEKMLIVECFYREILSSKRRYEVGLEKLQSAASEIDIMRLNLEQLQPQLIVSARNVQETVKQVENEKSDASEMERVVMDDEKVANKQVS